MTRRDTIDDPDAFPHHHPERDTTVPQQPAEHALLGLLRLAGGTAHGYELARQFRRGQPLGDVIHLEPAMLYKHLKKLARLGWVTRSFVEQSPRPPRQMCRLTAEGESELQRWLAEPVARTREIRLEFLVKLYFAWRFDPANAQRLAAEQRAVILERVDSLSRQLAASTVHDVNAIPLDDVETVFKNKVLELRLQQTRAAAAWLEVMAHQLGKPQLAD